MIIKLAIIIVQTIIRIIIIRIIISIIIIALKPISKIYKKQQKRTQKTCKNQNVKDYETRPKHVKQTTSIY